VLVAARIRRGCLVDPLNVFGWYLGCRGVTTNRRGRKRSSDSRQELFDGKWFGEKSFRLDHDSLACQVAHGMARHEKDVKFVLQRKDLWDEIVPVDARVAIFDELS
jgi:hypothetical protein